MLQRSMFLASAVFLLSGAGWTQAGSSRTRIAIVGLDHGHVWGLIPEIAKVPKAELVAIADPHPDLVARAKALVPASVKFYSDYVKMLDDAKPQAVFVTTENDRHLEILRQCARRHISVSTEKPMATNAADAREMARLARQAGIQLMVNYWNLWVPSTHELVRRVSSGGLGPVGKILVEYGHQGPREIGAPESFTAWLYDPVKNGGGALMDFGCYGAELALWLKGRPSRVFAYSLKLKTAQHNAVEDDAVILLEYPDATAVLMPSWDWPYSKGQVEVFGPKGSLLASQDELLYRPARSSAAKEGLAGRPVQLQPLPPDASNPIAYFVDCARNHKPLVAPLSAELNVEVMEILDAAKESIRTGRPVDLK
jgi:scyllo-inositol 2-dehydrogenase (NADP+)